VGAYRPASQRTQATLSELYSPAEQSRHDARFATESLPAAHAAQKVAPTVML
jgi:hypothetical protein